MGGFFWLCFGGTSTRSLDSHGNEAKNSLGCLTLIFLGRMNN